MFEKVNPAHPDKIADRIAGALVDLAYKSERNPRIAVEVLIGHGTCHIIAETSVQLSIDDVTAAVHRIAGFLNVDYSEVPQDVHLSRNQSGAIRCGDNGIFKGVPVTAEQKELVGIATDIYNVYPFDGKYIIDNGRVIICQSNAEAEELRKQYATAEINPLGDWTGGTDVDTGATNRKLGSDMADSVTGGGLHGKDLSKADVSVNIYAWLKAQLNGDSHYARIALLRVGDIESDDEDNTEQAFRAIQDMDFVKYHVFPKGYMIRTSSESSREQVRISREAVQKGMTFRRIGADFIRQYKQNRNILAVKLLFITEPEADYAALTRNAKTVKDITMSLTKILEGMPTDCGSCNLKAICDEVEGMRELHFGKEHHTTE